MGSTDSKTGMTGMGDDSMGGMGDAKPPNTNSKSGMGDM
jgi:hypothetical protein